MGSAGALYIAIKGDSKDFVKALKNCENVTIHSSEKMGKSMEKVSKATDMLRRAVVLLASAWAVREIVRVADAYTLIDSKLKLVTRDTTEFNKVYERLFQISQETGTSFMNNAATFTNVQLNLQNAGIEVETTANMIETFTKALIINGSTQREAASATLQWKQALSSGRLAGEEFRGVSEGNTYWMSKLAEVTGMTVGEIRALSMAQKLTSEFIIKNSDALAEAVEKDWGSITKTVERGINEIKNALQAIFTETNKSTEGTKLLAEALSDIATILTRDKETYKEVLSVLTEGFGEAGTNVVKIIGFFGELLDKLLEFKKLREELGLKEDEGFLDKLLTGGGSTSVTGSLLKGGEAALAIVSLFADKALEGAQNIFPDHTVANMLQATHASAQTAESMLVTYHLLNESVISAWELRDHFESIADASDQTAERLEIGAKNAKEVADATATAHLQAAKELPKDSWLIQMEDAPKVAERVQEAIEELGEAAEVTAEQIQKIDDALTEAFSNQDFAEASRQQM